MTRYPLAIAAAALLALSLAGCSAPATDTSGSDTGGDSGSSDTSGDTTTSGGSGNSGLVTLAGSGDYTVGVTAPVGSYELTGKPSTQPDGCSWALEDANGNTTSSDTGPTLVIAETDKFFQTSGCPDWVQTK